MTGDNDPKNIRTLWGRGLSVVFESNKQDSGQGTEEKQGVVRNPKQFKVGNGGKPDPKLGYASSDDDKSLETQKSNTPVAHMSPKGEKKLAKQARKASLNNGSNSKSLISYAGSLEENQGNLLPARVADNNNCFTCFQDLVARTAAKFGIGGQQL